MTQNVKFSHLMSVENKIARLNYYFKFSLKVSIGSNLYHFQTSGEFQIPAETMQIFTVRAQSYLKKL